MNSSIINGFRLKPLPWCVWILTVNILLLLATGARLFPNELPYVWRLTTLLNLATELTFAAWWSGALLLIAAFLCYELATDKRHVTRSSWLILFVTFLILSLDEVGLFT